MNFYKALKAHWLRSFPEKDQPKEGNQKQIPEPLPKNEAPNEITPVESGKNDWAKRPKKSLEETRAIVKEALSLKETNLKMMRHMAALSEQRRKAEKRARENGNAKDATSDPEKNSKETNG